ncbi:MAG: DoxX family protein [Proteobacteria bacterium]|nr:DoxX family protein [Pseudomonadota bacterium]
MAPAIIGALLRQPWFAVGARVALTSAYWWGGIAKLADFPGAVAEMRHFGLEPAQVLAALTIAVEIGASILVILGRGVWLASGALGVFTVLATLVAHSFWTFGDPAERVRELNIFLEHIGLLGGFVLAAILAEPARDSR